LNWGKYFIYSISIANGLRSQNINTGQAYLDITSRISTDFSLGLLMTSTSLSLLENKRCSGSSEP